MFPYVCKDNDFIYDHTKKLLSPFSATHPVTDSAAGGTALATGKKTYNDAIGMDTLKNPLYSVAVKAKEAGRKVGITTTVSIDHATPAAFYAHQTLREFDIRR